MNGLTKLTNVLRLRKNTLTDNTVILIKKTLVYKQTLILEMAMEMPLSVVKVINNQN